jgi:kynurenine formamidase
MAKFIELSHVIEGGMLTYPGLPGPKISDHLSREASRQHYAEGTTFQIGKIEMVANTGTYIDAPFHRYDEGKDLSQLDMTSACSLTPCPRFRCCYCSTIKMTSFPPNVRFYLNSTKQFRIINSD